MVRTFSLFFLFLANCIVQEQAAHRVVSEANACTKYHLSGHS